MPIEGLIIISILIFILFMVLLEFFSLIETILIIISIYVFIYILFFIICLILQIKRLRLKKDYSSSSINILNGSIFMHHAILPKDRDFFKNTMIERFTRESTKLPAFNMNDYDFTNVPINHCKFTKDTVLPEDTQFFQNIHNKSLYGCSLPAHINLQFLQKILEFAD